MSSSRYSVEALTIDRLLAPDSARFSVPAFQRRYAWTQDEVGELLDDLYADLLWLTDQEPTTHFLGSIVLAKSGDNRPDSVLDGQQRLTTLCMLLAALRHRMHAVGHSDANELNKYLKYGQFGGRKHLKIKLQSADDGLLDKLVDNPAQHDVEACRANMAFHAAMSTIWKRLDKFGEEAARASKSLPDAYAALTQRLLNYVEIVKITAVSERDAFRLFETLNNRGMDLNAADLIKNKLFAHISAKDGSRLEDMQDTWRDILGTFELLGPDDRPDMVTFLRHYWIASQGEVRKDNLYDEVAKHIQGLRTAEECLSFANEAAAAAKVYCHVSHPHAALPFSAPWLQQHSDALARLNTYRARSCRPAILACARHHRDILGLLLQACESITVRYSVIGNQNPNALERAYTQLANVLRTTTRLALAELRAELSRLFPDVPADPLFEQQFAEYEADRPGPVCRELLVRLNEADSTKETVVRGPKEVHIEHILPVSPGLAVLKECGLSQRDVEGLIPNIGNLTLLSEKLNRKASNSPYSLKRPLLQKSEIPLTKQVVLNETWGGSQIRERAKHLASVAVRVWPWPV